MRMGIAHRRFAVRRPTGMCNADLARQGVLLMDRLQLLDLTQGTVPGNTLIIIQDRHPGRVIAPIFQSFQTLQ